MTSSDFFERSIFSFILGSIVLIISLALNYPYLKKKKIKPKYGIKREKSIDYLKDGVKIISYSRMKGLLYLGFFLIILSVFFLLSGIVKLQ